MAHPIDIYLINLDRRPDRLARVKSRLDQLDLPFIRFSAIDGREPTAPIAKAQHRKFIINQKKRPVAGELACAASHIEVWKLFLQSKADYALILEDDIEISENLNHFLQEYLNHSQMDFLNISSRAPYNAEESNINKIIPPGILNRPSIFDYKLRSQWRKIEWRRTWRIFKIHPLQSGGIICECDPAPALGSGYVISRRAAEAFLKISKNIYFPIDIIWRFSSGSLRQGFLATPLVFQTNADTDIPGRFDQGRIRFIYRILRPLLKSRRLRRRIDVIRLYGISSH